MRVVIVIGIVCGVLVALAYLLQSRFVYFPSRSLVADPSDLGLPFETINLETADRIQLSGWFVPHDKARGVILFCHGNAGNISYRLESIQVFHRLGLEVFIFDYRGYGQSQGRPTERGTYEDVRAAWMYLTQERNLLPDRIILFGRSIGGAIASNLACEHMPGAVILESTFTSMPDLAADIYRLPLVRHFTRFNYNTAEYIQEVDCPILIIHSRDDDIVPFSHGRRLFEIAPEPKRFLEITGTHNEGFITAGEYYESRIDDFLSEFLPAIE
jgi:fermentation-respiration switch protein FrsA (DUF1100 family)